MCWYQRLAVTCTDTHKGARVHAGRYIYALYALYIRNVKPHFTSSYFSIAKSNPVVAFCKIMVDICPNCAL